MNFILFKTALQQQFQRMVGYPMFRTLATKDAMWTLYLDSFPVGTNPMYKERTEHDCQCCKSFIRNIGNLVAVIDNKLVSIWDVTIAEPGYQVVTDALSLFVKSHAIDNFYLHEEGAVGTNKTLQELLSKEIKTWEHFHVTLPKELVQRSGIAETLGEYRSTKDVMLRSLTELTVDSMDTVLELIGQGSLYRGEEHKFVVSEFLKVKKQFDKLSTDTERDLFCWSKVKTMTSSIARIRNTVIGSLLVDLSEGKDMEFAVKSFEQKVAPSNYKRPTALVTKGMIDKAKATLAEMGLTTALDRRHATLGDISINNVLFADRSAKKVMADVFDDIAANVPVSTKNLDKVEKISIDDFISNIVPKAESLELMVENSHIANMVSLVAPVDPTAHTLFKWDNKFSWSYMGEMADSIKERVKLAGGMVEGYLRSSLSWYNHDDLDLAMREPDGNKIYFGNRTSVSPSGGKLDVDMNAGGGTTRTPVENIIYQSRDKMKGGTYNILVNNYSLRETSNVGFEVELEVNGVINTFNYAKPVKNGETIEVAVLKYTKKDGIRIVKSLPSSQSVKEVCGISTQSFQKVSAVMLSPNHWDNKVVGNKHYFFMLDGCKMDEKVRGFFNEFLKEDLNQHRKVFEVVGSKLKLEDSTNQLSGLGFSSTQRNRVLCRVKGSFNRVVEITF